jgi:yeast amino acid transporter
VSSPFPLSHKQLKPQKPTSSLKRNIAKKYHSAINILAVGAFGEAEFWLSGGKVILIFSLFFFTFITMVGGNPQGDAYGFRNWKRGGAFREYIDTGDLGRFQGFLSALTSALFTVVGPEYISIVAAEAVRPRVYIKAAFKMVYVRFGIFFIGGALAVGIVCNSRDPRLEQVVLGGSSGSAAASPYVIAMQNLGIGVFPHIVNAYAPLTDLAFAH